mmetsp:Transcript_70518/g.117092  ORF Transcript_70518/g.117092 Transcript_70518/m.117092 type:complete len:248 (-) Transcript_70518:3384-4127(-)
MPRVGTSTSTSSGRSSLIVAPPSTAVVTSSSTTSSLVSTAAPSVPTSKLGVTPLRSLGTATLVPSASVGPLVEAEANTLDEDAAPVSISPAAGEATAGAAIAAAGAAGATVCAKLASAAPRPERRLAARPPPGGVTDIPRPRLAAGGGAAGDGEALRFGEDEMSVADDGAGAGEGMELPEVVAEEAAAGAGDEATAERWDDDLMASRRSICSFRDSTSLTFLLKESFTCMKPRRYLAASSSFLLSSA